MTWFVRQYVRSSEEANGPIPSGTRPDAHPKIQYASALTISPAWIELIAIQIWALIEFFTKWTEPSPRRVLIPPACRLRAPANPLLSLTPPTQGSLWSGSFVQKLIWSPPTAAPR